MTRVLEVFDVARGKMAPSAVNHELGTSPAGATDGVGSGRRACCAEVFGEGMPTHAATMGAAGTSAETSVRATLCRPAAPPCSMM